MASRSLALQMAAPYSASPCAPAKQKSGYRTGPGMLASGTAIYSLSHGEGQLEVLLRLRGAQGAVVEGIREE